MPTYEAIAAVVMGLGMWGLARINRWGSLTVAGLVAASCVYAAVAWGLWFGGPVILVGTAVGLALGWVAGSWERAGMDGVGGVRGGAAPSLGLAAHGRDAQVARRGVPGGVDRTLGASMGGTPGG